MELLKGDFDMRYQRILDTCTPYILTYPGNLSALNLAPFGWKIPEEHIYDPTRLHSRRLVDGLHLLDAFSFGPQEMLMPRWVLFDCGEFPGIVYGFGRKAAECPREIREAYKVTTDADDDVFIPLSMWVGIPCAEPGAWFGHNLSSVNVVAKTEPLYGLATITKSLGVKVAKIEKQCGATQWDSSSLGIHMSLGKMRLLCAYTPAHTHEETFAYRINTTDEGLIAPLQNGFSRPTKGGDRYIDSGDSAAIKKLHDDIEKGAQYDLHRVEKNEDGSQRLWLAGAQ